MCGYGVRTIYWNNHGGVFMMVERKAYTWTEKKGLDLKEASYYSGLFGLFLSFNPWLWMLGLWNYWNYRKEKGWGQWLVIVLGNTVLFINLTAWMLVLMLYII